MRQASSKEGHTRGIRGVKETQAVLLLLLLLPPYAEESSKVPAVVWLAVCSTPHPTAQPGVNNKPQPATTHRLLAELVAGENIEHAQQHAREVPKVDVPVSQKKRVEHPSRTVDAHGSKGQGVELSEALSLQPGTGQVKQGRSNRGGQQVLKERRSSLVC